MPSNLEETLAEVGYAKVICALKPTVAAASSRAELEKHFTIPSERQMESLLAAASRAASRKSARPQPMEKQVQEHKMKVYPHLGLVLGFVDRDGAAALAASRQVERVVEAPEMSLIRPFATRSARLAAAPTWGIKRLKVNRLWAQGLKGRGVIVGHLDTGIDGAHPALGGAIAAFAEFDLAGDQVPGARPWDSGNHGTHTAGTIVGRSVPRGAFGVAPEARVASAMVIEGGDVIARILAGMDWVIEQRAPILCMSLGLPGFTPAFQTLVDALRRANVLPVIAVGNEGPNTSRSPGNYANVLSVGAMDPVDEVADFSGSQRFNRPDDPLVPDLVAPGVDVLSCVPNGRFAKKDGSSMATPHVAGLAALLLAAEPGATAGDLEQAILRSCVRPAGMLEARGNRGVPDAVAALRILREGQIRAVA